MALKVKNIAFTLAETLLVVGIIGIVSALTLPNLNQATGNKETVAKVKKIHSELENAFGMAVSTYGPVKNWGSLQKMAERITESMNVRKNCGTGSGCFTSGKIAKDLTGATRAGTDYNGSTDYYKYILADGTSLSFLLVSTTCAANDDYTNDSSHSTYYPCAEIGVDVDGPNRGPYSQGKDYFSFLLTRNGVIPRGIQGTKAGVENKLKEKCFTEGTSCAGWVITNGNMDYLKANKGTCPNSTSLSWTNTSCK